MTRRHPPLTGREFAGIVIAAPFAIAVLVKSWPWFVAQITRPYTAAELYAVLAVFAVVIVGLLAWLGWLVVMPAKLDDQRECCTDAPERGE